MRAASWRAVASVPHLPGDAPVEAVRDAVLAFLTACPGVRMTRIMTAVFGRTHPDAPAFTSDGNAMRRTIRMVNALIKAGRVVRFMSLDVHGLYWNADFVDAWIVDDMGLARLAPASYHGPVFASRDAAVYVAALFALREHASAAEAVRSNRTLLELAEARHRRAGARCAAAVLSLDACRPDDQDDEGALPGSPVPPRRRRRRRTPGA